MFNPPFLQLSRNSFILMWISFPLLSAAICLKYARIWSIFFWKLSFVGSSNGNFSIIAVILLDSVERLFVWGFSRCCFDVLKNRKILEFFQFRFRFGGLVFRLLLFQLLDGFCRRPSRPRCSSQSRFCQEGERSHPWFLYVQWVKSEILKLF